MVLWRTERKATSQCALLLGGVSSLAELRVAQCPVIPRENASRNAEALPRKPQDGLLVLPGASKSKPWTGLPPAPSQGLTHCRLFPGQDSQCLAPLTFPSRARVCFGGTRAPGPHSCAPSLRLGGTVAGSAPSACVAEALKPVAARKGLSLGQEQAPDPWPPSMSPAWAGPALGLQQGLGGRLQPCPGRPPVRPLVPFSVGWGETRGPPTRRSSSWTQPPLSAKIKPETALAPSLGALGLLLSQAVPDGERTTPAFKGEPSVAICIWQGSAAEGREGTIALLCEW